MFGVKKKKDKEDNEGVMKKSSRGNMDEYEALRTIVAENNGLLLRVLEKIRVARVLSGKPKTDQPELESKQKTGPERKAKPT